MSQDTRPPAIRSAPVEETSVAPVEFMAPIWENTGVLLTPVEERRRRDRESPELLQQLVHAHDAIRIGIGERAQEDPVDDAEDGAAGADAKCQRENRDDGKPRRAQQLTNRVRAYRARCWQTSTVLLRLQSVALVVR